MNNENNFFLMGSNRAKENLISLKSEAQKIKEEYGIDAQLEFESGIVTTIPTYQYFNEQQKEIDFLANEVFSKSR